MCYTRLYNPSKSYKRRSGLGQTGYGNVVVFKHMTDKDNLMYCS